MSARAGWAALGLAALAALALAVQLARADTTPIEDSPDLPWTDPDHQSSIELLAGRIASTLAKRTVTVRCEGDTDWRSLVAKQRADPNSELGFVGIALGPGGQLAGIASSAELAGATVCLPLKQFAVAPVKPTKCRSAYLLSVTVKVPTRVRVRKTVLVGGKRHVKWAWVTKRVPTQRIEAGPFGPPAPCYPVAERVQTVAGSYWDDYRLYAVAIQTLGHESFHLGGVDALNEAKAQCYGMQWIPFIAEQLGDSPDDAHAIAEYYWDSVYPGYQGLGSGQYWSPECRPGGALDIRAPGTTAWP